MQILYADAGLRGLEGHHASSAAALPAAFQRLGHDVTVLGHRELSRALQLSTGAKPFFRAFTYDTPSLDPIAGWLTNFAIALEATVLDLRRAWLEFGPFDLVYFNSAKPAQIAALGQWIKAEFVTTGVGPKIVVELGTEAGLDRSGTADAPTFVVREPTALLYRHARNWIGKKWMREVKLATVAEEAAKEYEFLFDVPVKVLPFPQPQPLLRRRMFNNPLTIGLLGHQRLDKGWQFAPEFIPRVLQRYPSVRFIAHQSDPESLPEVDARLSELARREPRLELIIVPAINKEWHALIDRCDIVVLPYDPIRYRGSYSAIVGEALAAGAPLVLPSETTLSSAVKANEGGASYFTEWKAEPIAKGIAETIDNFDVLARKAYSAGAVWRERHGPDPFVQGVIAAAGLDGFIGRARRATTQAKRGFRNLLARS